MSEEGTLLQVGTRYQIPISPTVGDGGASANFLTDNGNFLQVLLPNVSKREIKEVTSANVIAGLIVDGPLIMWLFKFGEYLAFDCPYDARIIPNDVFTTYNVREKITRLMMSVHLVDTATMKLHGLRAITLPAPLILKFITAAKLQRERTEDINPYLQKYLSIPLPKLISQTTMMKCGV